MASSTRYLTTAFLSLWLVVLGGPAEAADQSSHDALRFGVVLPAPAARIHKAWQPFLTYVSERTDRPVEIVIPRGLENVQAAIENQQVDFLYINAYLYSLLHERGLVTAIAQMQNVGGSIYSQGRFLVRSDSEVRQLEDLRGRKLALISPLGAGAYLAPRAYLRERDIDVEEDVDVVFTKDLKKAAYMVMLGDADAAVMCGVNYNMLSHKIDTGELTILDSTAPFPEAVIAAVSRLDEQTVARVQAAVLDVDNEQARAALEPLHGLKIQTFVPYDPSVEEKIADMRVQGGLN